MQLTGRQIAYRSGAERWTARIEKEELRADGRRHHFLTGIRAQDASGAEIGVPGSGGSEWLRLDSSRMTWSDDYGHEDEPFELCVYHEFLRGHRFVDERAAVAVTFGDSLADMTMAWDRFDGMRNSCVITSFDVFTRVICWKEHTKLSGGSGFSVDTETTYTGHVAAEAELCVVSTKGTDGAAFTFVAAQHASRAWQQLTGRQIAYRSGAERWTARIEKEELRADGRLHHFLTGIRAQDASGAQIGVPGSGDSEWLRLDSSRMTWSDDYGHEDEPFELCVQLQGILPASTVLQVSGAGSAPHHDGSAANGCYHIDGQKNGKPRYRQLGGGSHLIFFSAIEDGRGVGEPDMGPAPIPCCAGWVIALNEHHTLFMAPANADPPDRPPVSGWAWPVPWAVEQSLTEANGGEWPSTPTLSWLALGDETDSSSAEIFPGLNRTFTDPARLSVRFDDSLQTMTVTWLRLDVMKNRCVAEFKEDVLTWRESTNVSGGAGFTVDTSTSYRGRLSDGGRLRLLVDGSDGSHFELVEELGKFTNAPYDHAVFRTWDESNYKQVYVHGTARQYKDGSASQRTAWLKESLACPAICVEFDCVRNKKETVLNDGTTFAAEILTDPDEMALYLWTWQDRPQPPADSAEGVYKRVNHALLCDDPEWLSSAAYFMRAVARYIVSHPAEVGVKLYRGTRIIEKQKVAVDKAAGVGGRVFRQPMFVAASESEAEAAKFTEKGSPILEFEVPAGCCNCAKIPQRLSMFPDEQEWLMPPYTPVEWLRQEERTFAGGEVRLVVTLKVLDGLVVSRDPQYAGANAPRTCMIMCEMPAARLSDALLGLAPEPCPMLEPCPMPAPMPCPMPVPDSEPEPEPESEPGHTSDSSSYSTPPEGYIRCSRCGEDKARGCYSRMQWEHKPAGTAICKNCLGVEDGKRCWNGCDCRNEGCTYVHY